MENDIDIVGSWLEIGMIVASIVAGGITVLIPFIRRNRKRIRFHQKTLHIASFI